MKFKTFDGRWDEEEMTKFLDMDGKNIKVRFITEFEYKIRIYYDEVTFTRYSSISPINSCQSQPLPYQNWSRNQNFAPFTGGNTQQPTSQSNSPFQWRNRQ